MPYKPRTRSQLINRSIPEAMMDIERQLRELAEKFIEVQSQMKEVEETLEDTATLDEIQETVRHELDSVETRILKAIRNGT